MWPLNWNEISNNVFKCNQERKCRLYIVFLWVKDPHFPISFQVKPPKCVKSSPLHTSTLFPSLYTHPTSQVCLCVHFLHVNPRWSISGGGWHFGKYIKKALDFWRKQITGRIDAPLCEQQREGGGTAASWICNLSQSSHKPFEELPLLFPAINSTNNCFSPFVCRPLFPFLSALFEYG